MIKRSPVPSFANMVEDGVTPWLAPQALEEMGFTFAAYPLTLLSSCAAAMQQTLAQLQAGQQASNRLTFSEIKEVLEFSRFDQVEEKYKTQ